MVGVPGKYKGCHTCRERRVPCDNVRPECLRCKKANRTCKGYEKTTRFILSGLQDGGRCSLQPRRKISSTGRSRAGSKPKPPDLADVGSSASAESRASNSPGLGLDLGARNAYTERPDPNVIVTEPSQSAWDVYAIISKSGIRYFPRVVAIHTQLDQLHRQSSGVGDQGQTCTIRVPALSTPDIRSSPGEEKFEVKAQCLLHLSPNDIVDDFLGVQANSFCLFVYEQNSSMAINKYDPPWKYGADDPNSIRSQGPSRFRTFPAHQFFARIYRPTTIYAALLNRKPVFLSANEWMTTPWEIHQKTHLDTLFDFIVSLPSIFHRTDKVLMQPPTYDRYLEAQDLLANCQSVERTLREWHDMVVLTISQYSSAPSSVQSSPRAQASRSPTPAAGSSSSPTPSHADLESYVGESSQLILAPTNPYWSERQDLGVDVQFPFQDQYSFKDGHTALAFIHYWTAQVLLFRCIAQLHTAIIQPILAQPAAQLQVQPGVQMGMQHPSFHTTLLAGYGIPTTSAAGYSVIPSTTSQAAMIGIPAIEDLMGMQHHHHQVPQSRPLPHMLQLQPPSLYDFSPGVTMAGIQHQMAGVTGTGMHQTGNIPAHAPIPSHMPPTTPPMPTTPQLGSDTVEADHSHAGVPDPNRYSDAAVKELSGQVCRSLCFALVHSTASLHPDTLVSPLAAVEGFYKQLAASGRHSVDAELVWCAWFRNKIVQRKSEIEQAILSDRQWIDEGSW